MTWLHQPAVERPHTPPQALPPSRLSALALALALAIVVAVVAIAIAIAIAIADADATARLSSAEEAMTSPPSASGASAALPAQLPVELLLPLRRVLAGTHAPDAGLAVDPRLGSALGLDAAPDADSGPDSDIAAALRALTPGGGAPQPAVPARSGPGPSPSALSSGDVLASMHTVRAALEEEDRMIEQLEARYAAAIAPAQDGSSVGARLAAAQAELSELLSSLGSMRELAQKSEGVVLDLTADIRKLDVAKANVVASMTALKRLQMFSVGVAQLAQHTNGKQYTDAAPALLAVRSLQEDFSLVKWASVQRVASLSRTADSLASQLEKDAFALFTSTFTADPALGGGSGPAAPPGILPSAACALDALGPQSAARVLDWYATSQLREYRRLFRPQDEAGGLDNAEQRYRWYTRLLDRFDQAHAAAFRFKPAPGSPTAALANADPTSSATQAKDPRTTPWRVDRVLTAAFAQNTRDDLKSALRREQSRLTVAALLAPMEATIQFEHEMQTRFHMPFTELLLARPVPPAPTSLGGNAAIPRISTVFEPYLSIFVDAQDRTLTGMIRSFRRGGAGRSAPSTTASAAGWTDKEGTGEEGKESDASVLASSTELFIFYRQALDQALRLVPPSKKPGAAPPALLRELAGVFKKHLRAYATDVLVPALSDPPSAEDLAGEDDPVRARLLAQAHAGAKVLNTSAYCAETSKQLEERILALLTPTPAPEDKDKESPGTANFSLESEVEQFHSCAGQAINALVRTLEGYLEPAWAQLRNPGRDSLSRRWDDDADGSGEDTGRRADGSVPGTGSEGIEEELETLRVLPTSTYVDLLASALEIVATVVRTEVQSARHVRVWCDKSMASVTQRLGQEIVYARPVTPSRATQLRRDALEIRTLLLELPPRDEGARTALASYTRMLDRSWGRVDSLLRVLAVPQAQGPDGVVRAYADAIGDRSMANFQKILELRGARRLEQNTLNDAFDALLASEAGANLTDASFLTSLDLDSTKPQAGTAAGRGHPDLSQAPPGQAGGGVSSLLASRGGGEWHARLPNLGSLQGVFGSDAHSEEDEDNSSHHHPALAGVASPPPGKATPTFPDLRRFGTFLGALGRRRDTYEGNN